MFHSCSDVSQRIERIRDLVCPYNYRHQLHEAQRTLARHRLRIALGLYLNDCLHQFRGNSVLPGDPK